MREPAFSLNYQIWSECSFSVKGKRNILQLRILQVLQKADTVALICVSEY